MRWISFLMLTALVLLAPAASAQGGVLFIIDGLGSSYLTGYTAKYANGEVIPLVDMASFRAADARYQLIVPVPATEYGHAVIVTGYANVSPEEVAYYHATIFDALRDNGFLALGILENGDSTEMLAELDAVVHVTNNSVYSPDVDLVLNGQSVPPSVASMMRAYKPPSKIKASKDPYAPYIRYNAWAICFARDFVEFVDTKEPSLDYLLVVNAGGLDSAGQNLGYDGYRAVMAAMDDDLAELVEACRRSGTVLLITADHGMSFPDAEKRGSHASTAMAGRDESLLVPLLIYANGTAGNGTYGQDCLAPTLLSILDAPDTLSMGDGTPLPVKARPTLYLISAGPANVTLTGPGLGTTVKFNGTYRVAGLEKGDYLVEYDGRREAVRLDHDTVVEIRPRGGGAIAVPPWMAFASAAVIAAAGIVAALGLLWAKK